MNRAILFTFTLGCVILAIQQKAMAEMTQDEICVKLGEISGQASQLRLDGMDMENATSQFKSTPEITELGLPDKRIDGAVRIAYMAKMQPESMRSYFVEECRKDILN